MRFRLAPEFIARFPDAFVGIVAASGVPNDAPAPPVEAALRAAEAEARERLDGATLADHPFIARWREAFKLVGVNPSKYKSSVEALLSRVQKGSALPSLAPAVDLANAVSLRYMLPVGAHDVERLSGDLAVRIAAGGEPFQPIGGAPAEAAEPGEIVYVDAAEVRTRRWIWRQGDNARVTPATRSVFFPIDGWLGLNEAETREAARELARLLHDYLGAQTSVMYVSAANPEVQVFENGVPVAASGDEARSENDGGLVSRGAVTGSAGFQPAPDLVRGPAGSPSSRFDSVQVQGNEAPIVASVARAAGRDPGEIDELLTRGVVDVIVREDVQKRLRAGEKLRVKLGIDPTGPKLHIGRAVALRKLRQFQELGHTICLVIGDFTAQIGDPSDKDAARRMLTELEVYENMANYKQQIGRILDVDKVEWSYNSDWLGQLRFKDVVSLAQHFTVAQMLERENFSLRYAEGKPIGLHEFFYPLMQGYDSYALKADLEVGGTDQLFNLMAARPIQRSLGQRPQDVMTLQMIWGLDGRKMSTSEGNTILIEEPAVDMYGKVMSMSDEHIIPYFEVATDVPMSEVREIARSLAGGENPMLAKKRLAYAITRLYQGDAGALDGQRYFEHLHQKRDAAEVEWPEVELAGAQPRQVGALFVEAGLVTSNGEARNLITQSGLEIDGHKVSDFSASVTPYTGMKLRRGKNKLARLRVV